jgi:threonine dehydratase
MPLFTLAELEDAAALVHGVMPPTPQYVWPQLARRAGAEVWVKHENHTPIGAFKVRGGIVYLDWLKRHEPKVTGVITATRGNHGQSVAFAARRAGIPCVIVVPEGNSPGKNAAMSAFGAELAVHGRDFDEAKAHAAQLAEARGLHFVPSFDARLVLGVATYALELFRAAPGLATVYAPIGLGSGICGLVTARDLLGLDTEIVGVVSEHAAGYALSYEAGRVVATSSAHTFADGVAVREPHPEALAIIRAGVARMLRLTEAEIAEAIRAFFADTHNLAEGAGAAALAGLLREKARRAGHRAGVILTGGNIDAPMFTTALAGGTPGVGR